jgi:hypothetical protein
MGMRNKIIGSIIIFLGIVSFCSSVILLILQKEPELVYSLFVGSFFAIIVGIVIFRHGFRGIVEAYRDGTPPGLR